MSLIRTQRHVTTILSLMSEMCLTGLVKKNIQVLEIVRNPPKNKELVVWGDYSLKDNLSNPEANMSFFKKTSRSNRIDGYGILSILWISVKRTSNLPEAHVGETYRLHTSRVLGDTIFQNADGIILASPDNVDNLRKDEHWSTETRKSRRRAGQHENLTTILISW